MAEVRVANCKICGKEYSYSIEWAESLEAQGRQPTEYCNECRKYHSQMRATLAMPYFKPKPTGPRKPDEDLVAGRLGRLHHIDRNHRAIEIPASFHLPGTDIDFGIKDTDILKLFDVMKTSRVTVVVGPTGSGKSTFLPYRLMAPPAGCPPDLFTRYGQIVITQPRIQATRTIPAFIARDLHGCPLGAGNDIGFIHKGETAADRHSKLVFCTDGMLINWIISGRISEFSVIMIDEAHERSLNIDLILGLLKQRLPLYPNLKLIIASATINADLFKDFFTYPGEETGMVNFEGKKKYGYEECRVDREISGQPRVDQYVPVLVDEVVRILQDIARGKRVSHNPESKGKLVEAVEGDILAFLPTVASIDKAANLLRVRIKEDRIISQRDIEVHILHRQVPLNIQDNALQKKSKALVLKILRVLDLYSKNGGLNGNLLALALDDKTVDETVNRLKEIFDKDPQRGLACLIRAYGKEPAWQDLGVDPLAVIEVATYEQASPDYREKFLRIVHDRRVVISTNVAETSLTVDGIVYVVDTGLILQKSWDLDTWTESFRVNWHSQDGCRQRWGRAGRVRDGYAYQLYTENQYHHFDQHTLPEISRAPVEAVVLKAKQAGIDNIADFPWIEPPDPKELKRAVETLTEHGLLDVEGDLTEHGLVVGKFAEEPNIGHLLVLADQLCCAIEIATLIPMLNYKIKGGLLRWQHQWDGYTRRMVKKIHRGLRTGCQDDLAFLLKIFYSWYESDQVKFNYLTDEDFDSQWLLRASALEVEFKTQMEEKVSSTLFQKARLVRSITDLEQLVEADKIDQPLRDWLNKASLALKDARRAAWARRFFVNHTAMVKILAGRQEILEKLSIGKKAIEDRPIDFDLIMERTRLVMAYAWPDRIYKREQGRYHAYAKRTRDQEAAFNIEISSESIVADQDPLPEAFVCCKRTAGSGKKKPLYVGTIIAVRLEWFPLLSRPVVQMAQWAAQHLSVRFEDKDFPLSRRIFFDQDYPLLSKVACTSVGRSPDGLRVNLEQYLSTPALFEETSQEGELIFAEEPADAVGNDLDQQAGIDPDLTYDRDPDAENPLAGLELDEDSESDDVGWEEEAPMVDEVSMGGLIPGAPAIIDSPVLCEVTGYPGIAEDPPLLRLRQMPPDDDFKIFQETYPVGSAVIVQVMEIEQDKNDPYAALVVKPLGFDIEIVMEARDLSFAGRYHPVEIVEVGSNFSTVIEGIDPHTRRVSLSVLPFLEAFLPQEDEVVSGVISEVTANHSFFVQFDDLQTVDLPVPISAYLDCDGLPESIRQVGEGAPVSIRVNYEPKREIKLLSVETEWLESIDPEHWQDRIGFDYEARKLWLKGRLTYEELQLLLSKTTSAHVRMVLRSLYRFSNTLTGQYIGQDLVPQYLSEHQPGSLITAQVIKTRKNSTLVELADGVWGSLTNNEVKKALNRWLRVGDRVDVLIEGPDPHAGLVSIKIATPGERMVKAFPVGSVHLGKVTRVESYGVYVRIDDLSGSIGPIGLVQKHNLRWGNPGNPAALFKLGEDVKVQVEAVHVDGKIDLTMRIPENRPEQLFGVGSQVTGEVTQLLEFGALVRLGPGQVGMIHISELAWEHVSRPDQVVGIGQAITVRILRIQSFALESKIDLTLKQAYQEVAPVEPRQRRHLLDSNGWEIKTVQKETRTRIFLNPDGTATIMGSTEAGVAVAKKRIIDI